MGLAEVASQIGIAVPPLEHHDEQRAEQMASHIRSGDADLVVFCEIWASSVRDRIISELQGLYRGATPR